MKEAVKMPTQRCRRSLTKQMANVFQSPESGSHKKRLRSNDEDNATTPRRKCPRLTEAYRKSPRVSKDMNDSSNKKTRKSSKEETPTKAGKLARVRTPNKKDLIKKSSIEPQGKNVTPKKKSPIKTCPDSKEKRDPLRDVTDSDSLSDENPMPTRSFYGGSKTPYLTPLQRKEICERRSSSTSKIASKFPTTANNVTEHNSNLTGKMRSRSKSGCAKLSSVGNTNKKTVSKVMKNNNLKKCLSSEAVLKVQQRSNEMTLSTKLLKHNSSKKHLASETVLNVQNICEEVISSTKNLPNKSVTPKKNQNRFFKNRSPGKKLQLALKKVGVSKNRFNMSFGASKVKKSNSIMESTKIVAAKDFKIKHKTDNLFNKGTGAVFNKENVQELEKSNLIIKSETQTLNKEKAVSINNKPYNNFEDSGRISAMSGVSDDCSVCSTGADSVLLLSEGESVRGPSPNTDSVNLPIYRKNDFFNVQSSEKLSISETTLVASPSKSISDKGSSVVLTPKSSPNSLKSEKISKDKNRLIDETPSTSPKSNVSERASSIIELDSPESSLSLKENDALSDDDGSDLEDTNVNTSIEKVVNIVEVMKTSKKLFSIFQPSAQSSPRERKNSSSCPGTPSSRISSTAASSPCVSSAKSSPKQIWKKVKDKNDQEQMMLDFGQKLQTVAPCSVCGITYTRGDPSDEATHSKFHQKMMNVLKFPAILEIVLRVLDRLSGWRKERVVQEMIDGGRILMVLPDDKQPMKKVNAVKQVVDQELGFIVEGTAVRANSKTFLYISLDKRIVGFCIAEVITKGYRVLSDEELQNIMSKSPTKRTRPWCCSTNPEIAKCGINRIWVLNGERNKGIASKLIDCVRYNFILGNILKQSQLAFSDPTPDGQMFASKYCGTPTFLVYHKQS